MDSAEPFPHGAIEAGDLAETLAGPPPFTSVRLSTDPREADASHRSEIRWKDLRRDLEGRGAPDAALRSITDLVPAAHLEGDTLFVVADADAVRLVDHSDSGEERDLGHLAPLPYLLPVIRSRQAAPPYVVVLTDRTGADLIGFRSGGPELAEKVRGETSVIHKVHAGGWSMRRYQQRAENTWVRTRRTSRPPSRPSSAGSRRASSSWPATSAPSRCCAGTCPPTSTPSCTSSPASAQGTGTPRTPCRRRRTTSWPNSFATRSGAWSTGPARSGVRTTCSWKGTAATADALARAQVAILLIAEVAPDASPPVWIGPEGTQLATSRKDVTAMGVDEPVEAPAVDALTRAAIATDALLRVTGDAGFADGVAALLRWKSEGLK